MGRRIFVFALLVFAHLGCSSPATPATAPSGITLALTGASVREAAGAFATQTGEPLVITPEAERYATCVHLSLLVPTPRPVAEVATLLDAPLRSEGFSLSRAATGWTLTHEGAAPTGCVGPIVGGPPPAPLGPVTETHAEIARADIEAWLADPGEMASSVRVIPDEEGGVVIGMRLYGIRRSSMMGQLGFQNGDTVYSVNGYALNTPENLSEAHAHLRDAAEYRVDMSRAGERRMHVIEVTGG